MKNVTLLAVGDSADFDSFRKFDKQKNSILKRGFDYRAMDYKKLFRAKRLDILTEKVIVFIFFPFEYWDNNIERKRYSGLYGNLSFMRKFREFSRAVVSRIKKLLAGTQIEFINDPVLAARYRDKQYVMKKLAQAGVNVPAGVKAKDIEGLKKVLSSGKEIYIKPRCGSMGKGITYITKERWLTNFEVRNGRIIQRCSDYGWKFKDVTGNRRFLLSLLRGDFLMEESIPSFTINHKKVDFRVYAFKGKVLYIYPRKNDERAVTTNISQGGRGSPAILKKMPGKLLGRIALEARRTINALGLEFAGIDIIAHKDLKNVYVVDINMFPGFPKRRTHDLAGDILMRLIKKQ